MQRMLATAVQASCRGELSAAGGTGCSRFESVEGLAALVAFPVSTERRSGITGGAGISGAPGQFGHAQQNPGMLKSAPAVQQNEDGDSPEPERLADYGESDEAEYSEQAENRCNHEAACTADYEPKERTKNLTAVEGVDRKDVKHQQSKIDVKDRLQKQEEIVLGRR